MSRCSVTPPGAQPHLAHGLLRLFRSVSASSHSRLPEHGPALAAVVAAVDMAEARDNNRSDSSMHRDVTRRMRRVMEGRMEECSNSARACSNSARAQRAPPLGSSRVCIECSSSIVCAPVHIDRQGEQ